ncbi:OstA-like protein [Saccharicrinis fermentans]|uniref:Organic solvent tolerance protein OstA n=1 Tax=Saccharicrinis fermentans DSM 9555 = JCM 21142 TaxID=869213 RepID=W7YRS9_9BACT|nr:OstA-like protein [Saccharicrinis fermentans]GAF05119.1 organic solvent tolerance protein OstA [Saccharicrinis fermentans DSM 9555 = JCM 21142]
MQISKSIFTALFLATLFCSVTTTAQRMVIVNNADSLNHNEAVYGKDVQVLIGNVKFTHETAVMYCDTAYRYIVDNKIKASGNIHIIQNDTLHLYGKKLNYDGNTGLAQVRKDVKLVNKDVVLTTDYLDYDRANNFAYYFNFGKIVNKENILTSKKGYYYPNTNQVFYKDSVVVNNPKYTIYSDTLIYHTETKVSNIEGPTFIISDSNTIYAEAGYYDMLHDIALLKENAYIDGEQLLKGDTIYYNRASGYGEIFNSMELHDTTNNVIIKGNYGFYNEITQDALATLDAQLLQIYSKDTLYLHADTLQAVPLNNGEEKLIKAYRKVKYFRKDMQGRCDSMVFDSRDTTNTFYYDPIMWSMGNQLTADVIKMYTKNEVLDKVDLIDRSFIISEEDTGRFNQVKGKLMTGYIRNNEIYKIDVNGNAQSIYFPKDREHVIGVNKAECSNMTLYLNQRMVDQITMRVSPNGSMNPPFLVPMKI